MEGTETRLCFSPLSQTRKAAEHKRQTRTGRGKKPRIISGEQVLRAGSINKSMTWRVLARFLIGGIRSKLHRSLCLALLTHSLLANPANSQQEALNTLLPSFTLKWLIKYQHERSSKQFKGMSNKATLLFRKVKHERAFHLFTSQSVAQAPPISIKEFIYKKCTGPIRKRAKLVVWWRRNNKPNKRNKSKYRIEQTPTYCLKRGAQLSCRRRRRRTAYQQQLRTLPI